MRQTPRSEILSEAFSRRAEALQALWDFDPRLGAASDLRAASERLADAGAMIGDSPAASVYVVMAELHECMALLCEWGSAVREAETDADRFRRAAQVRARELVDSLQDRSDLDLSPFTDLGSRIIDISAVEEISELIDLLKSRPLPIAIYRVPERPATAYAVKGDDERRHELAVAVTQFSIDGEPIGHRMTVRPNVLHDLSVELRLSRWPEGAESVRLEPLTVESPDCYEMPTFTFAPPKGETPFLLTDQARMRLLVPQTLRSRPMEFHYTLRFLPSDSVHEGSVEGQRTLRFEAIDPSIEPLTGYGSLDEKLLELRDQLRRQPGIPEEDMHSFLILLHRLSQLSAHARSDNRFAGKWSEKEFQREATAWLRSDPRIAANLEEHPRVGGGETDLSFHGIRLELKVDPDEAVGIEGAVPHFGQAAQYTSASGRRLGLITVLECADKSEPLSPLETDIGLRQVGEDHPIILGVVIVRGNLPRPSDL